MAINRLNFNTGPQVKPVSAIEQAGSIINKYLEDKDKRDRLAIEQAWQNKVRGRQEAEWARQDAEREANKVYQRGLLDSNQQIAGGVTDAANQVYNGTYKGLELTPQETQLMQQSGGDLSFVDPTMAKTIQSKLDAQEQFGRNLMADAPMETDLMKARRLASQANVWTPEIGKSLESKIAAELAAQQSTEKSLRDQRADYLKKVDDFSRDIAKERGGGIGKSKSGGSGSGTKGITFQEMYSKLPEKADVSWSMLPRGFQLDTNLGQENIENVVKTLAKSTGKSENVIREIALNELGNAFEPGFWGNTLNLDTQAQKDLFASKVKANLLSEGNGKYNYQYVNELEKQKAAAQSGVSDVDRRLAGVYADPRQARIDATADKYRGLLGNATSNDTTVPSTTSVKTPYDVGYNRTSKETLSRGTRNNNPGNITGGDTNWKGKVGMDGRFVKYETPEDGARALAVNLKNGAVGSTMAAYINKYAPTSENDTKAYIDQVTKTTGIKPGDKITNKDILPLMKAITKHETGGDFDENALEAGYEWGINGKEPSRDYLSRRIKTSGISGVTEKDKNIDKQKAITEDSSLKDFLSTSPTKGVNVDSKATKLMEQQDAGLTDVSYNFIPGAMMTKQGLSIGGKLLGKAGTKLINKLTNKIEGPGFVMKSGGRPVSSAAKGDLERKLTQEVGSLISAPLNPTSIKRLLDIAKKNSKFSDDIYEFLKTRGF